MRACAHECACIYCMCVHCPEATYLAVITACANRLTVRVLRNKQDVTVTFTTRDLRTQTVFSPARQMIAVVVTELFVQVSLCSVV